MIPSIEFPDFTVQFLIEALVVPQYDSDDAGRSAGERHRYDIGMESPCLHMYRLPRR